MSYAFGSLDELGEGHGFRKIRQALGVTAFGVNAIVLPPGAESRRHYHEIQVGGKDGYVGRDGVPPG